MKTVLLSALNIPFIISVVSETIWTALAGLAVGAEYMSEYNN